MRVAVELPLGVLCLVCVFERAWLHHVALHRVCSAGGWGIIRALSPSTHPHPTPSCRCSTPPNPLAAGPPSSAWPSWSSTTQYVWRLARTRTCPLRLLCT